MGEFRLYRLPLTVLFAGLLVRIVGAMMTIMHWPGNMLLLWSGTTLMAAGIISIMMRLWQVKKTNP